MPSQEDYLDNLLKNLEKGGTEKEGLPEAAAEEEIPEELLSDAVSELEATIESDSELHMDASGDTGQKAEDFSETFPEGADFLEDAVADLETVLGESDTDNAFAAAGEEAANPGEFSSPEGMSDQDIQNIIEGLEEPEEPVISEAMEGSGEPEISEAMEEPAILEATEVLEEPEEPVILEATDEPEEPMIPEAPADGEEAADAGELYAPEEMSDQDIQNIIEGLEEPEEPVISEAIKEPEEPAILEATEGSGEPEISEAMEEPAIPETLADKEETPEGAEIPDAIGDPGDGLDLTALADQDAEIDLGALGLGLDMEMDEPEEEAAPVSATAADTAPYLDAVSEMTEDEIERFLSAGTEEEREQEAASGGEGKDLQPEEDDDLAGLLGDTDDSDLLDIQDMLDKADNNEAVGQEIEALLQGEPGQGAMESVTETEGEKSRKAQERKRKRQEKAAAKKAAKEAKAAAKAAAKEAKKAGKVSTDEKTIEEAAGEKDPFDPELLDSIVSAAEQAGQESGGAGSDGEEFPGDTDLLADLLGTPDDGDALGQAAESGEDAAAGSEAEADDLGFDMSSLFGDDEGSLGTGDDVFGEQDSAFPDFLEADGGDVDAILPKMEEGGKKKGLFARFFEMLTEEAEDENESLRLSDENKDILSDLDKEKTAGKKKKKKGKKNAAGAEGEEGAEGQKGKGGKPAKAKKPKKPKPEKPPKEPEPEPLIPPRKLTLKRVLPVALVCASLGILIVVFANASVDFTDKQNAKEAYYSGDYQTCYENLFGKDLNETEQIMFGTSESILRVRLWMREYEMFVEAGEEVEALDVLIQAVNDFPKLYAYAEKWNAGDDVQAGYTGILNILAGKYGLTEAQALEIASVRSDYDYTEMVVDIVQGKTYGSWNEQPEEPETPEPEPLPDELPEEGDLGGDSFIQNQ